ncbi:hypothetical protein ACFSMW_06095 [Virgibacillus halophilus]
MIYPIHIIEAAESFVLYRGEACFFIPPDSVGVFVHFHEKRSGSQWGDLLNIMHAVIFLGMDGNTVS